MELWNGASLLVSKQCALRGCFNNNVELKALLSESEQQVAIEGSIRLLDEPMYQQRGELITVSKEQYYICVNVTQLKVFSAIGDLGDPTVFALLEWGGIKLRSRTVKKPQLN